MLTGDDLWAKWLMERVVICPTNEDCEELSQMMAKKIPGRPFIYRSFDRVVNQEEAINFNLEFLNSIKVVLWSLLIIRTVTKYYLLL